MKSIFSRISCPVIVIVFVVLFSSCATAPVPVEYVTMKTGPSPEILAEDGKPKIIPAGFIKRRLKQGIPSLEEIIINDRQYTYITEKWFGDVIEWTEEFIEAQVPNVDFQKNPPVGYEETFSQLASNIANLSVAKRYNIRSSVLIGLLIANSDASWGAIPADKKDRVYLVGLTDKGGIIYDLTTKQAINFEDFPNFDSIRGILF